MIGSFLNVLIYRLPRKESIVWPGSRCVACGHKLGIRDLIPIFSYLGLKGKCRYCQGEIAVSYPLVEGLTALSFLLVFDRWGFTLAAGGGCFFTGLIIVAAFTDMKDGVIPDSITYPGLITGILLSCFLGSISTAILGSAFFGGFLLLIAVLSRGGMGGGDVKLAAVIGAFLGLKGAVMVLVLSSFLGAIWVLPLLFKGKADRKTAVKFGPFLSLAAWVVMLWGNDILCWYWSILT
ncbi:MAG: prepilin peptidase [Syntrophomonas sp.]